ncbi:M56 family metallopeptidase [Glacieibacterium sp.]|uniref:M56 family metallopeptidase n=1 Tax=Glacieibacterium sp. TaxID=2860237 RepID=UPI003B006536
MTAFIAWGEGALLASAALMLLVMGLRTPVRRWLGPRLGYALWVVVPLRLVLPALPDSVLPLAGQTASTVPMLFVGPRGDAAAWQGLEPWHGDLTLLAIWLVGAVGVFATYSVRHVRFCHRLHNRGSDLGKVGSIRILATDVEGPLAFGVFQRRIAVPSGFTTDYNPVERELALAHEAAHHARGDLLANWASIFVLALHWWNPLAWVAIRAFRDDQEFATDAHVLAAAGPGALPAYARVLAKAAGIGALPACNLNGSSNLKGRLIMLGNHKQTSRRLALGGIVLVALGGTALAATATKSHKPGTAAGVQAVTIGVKPDGAGHYTLVVAGAAVAPSAPLPNGMTLPADFSKAGGCDLKPTAKPSAMAIKGKGTTQTYTVMCASAAPAPLRATLAEGLTSLNTMRASVATQPASKAFPETERAHALGAIDRSIHEVEASLTSIG